MPNLSESCTPNLILFPHCCVVIQLESWRDCCKLLFALLRSRRLCLLCYNSPHQTPIMKPLYDPQVVLVSIPRHNCRTENPFIHFLLGGAHFTFSRAQSHPPTIDMTAAGVAEAALRYVFRSCGCDPSNLPRVFASGEYSDLTVHCGGHDFNVHRNIVCSQSLYFANVVKEGRWLEGQTGVIGLKEDDPDAVKAMLEFLYTAEYTIPSHIPESVRLPPFEQMKYLP